MSATASGIPSLSPSQALRTRLRAQRLDPPCPADSVPEAVRASGGLQAQDWPSAVLGVRPRTEGLTAEDVERARVEDRSVVRSWFMRGTLHLVPAEDVGWLLGLLGPVFVAAQARRRADLGLDEATYAAGVRVLERALADGPLARAELGEALVRAGVGIDPKTQALIHLIQRAALEGRVCCGPGRDRDMAFVLLRDWVAPGPALEPEAALDELARRYLAAFAPAVPAGLAKWSGLPVPRCREAFARLAGEITEVRADGKAAWVPNTALELLRERAPDDPVLRLLPAYDTYLLGHVDHGTLVDARFERQVWRAGIVSPVAVLRGRIAATWKLERRRRETVLRVSPFAPLRPVATRALEAEAADVLRFLGESARLVVEAAQPE